MGDGPYPNGSEAQVSVGASVGWDWLVFKHLSLGTAVGFALGFGLSRMFWTVGRTAPFLWELDLHLLRIGFGW